jgi:hypothetical protein
MRRYALPLTVCCLVLLGWPPRARSEDKAQAKAIAALQELGGKIEVDDKSPDKPAIRLVLKGQTMTDKAMPLVTALAKLRHVEFHDTAVSGEGLKALKKLPKLDTLVIRDSIIDDDGMQGLQALANLQKLTLNDTEITGSGLKYLKKLSKLKYLDIAKNKEIDTKGIEGIKELTDLEYLNLSNTKINNKGVEQLKGLTKLKHLNLQFTMINSDALDHLHDMDKLKTLYLDEGRIDPKDKEGLKRLKEKLPKLTVVIAKEAQK